jgi:FkbH-like protein
MTATNSAEESAVRICIAANFTVEPIEEFLAFWMTQLSIRTDIRFAPYNQIFQQLLEGGMLRSNSGGVNLVALDLDAWLVQGPNIEASAQLERAVADLIAALRAAGSLGAGGAVLLFPPGPDQEDDDRSVALAAARASIRAECPSIPGWSVVELSDFAARYSVLETRDPFTDELGNIPFTEEMYAVAATAAARWIRAAGSKPRKVIVLDCDNTLWRGICGEGAVEVTPPYRRLQEFMLRQQEDGVLLALASKNNEADAMAVLESEACLLSPEHLTAWRVNWLPKSENLVALSEELGLGLNSFILIDDSSYECMEVRNQSPEVFAVPLPSDPEEIPEFLDHLWIFDRSAATEEDRNRARMYQAQRQRAELSRRALTQEEFLASLKLDIQIAPALESELPRVAQLTQRTTQFNVTGVLHTEQTLSSLLSKGRHECWTVRVRDVFGDYGLVGVVLFEITGNTLMVDSFLLSCRALGRRVEDAMVEKLRLRAVDLGAERVILPVVPTTRNRPAMEYLNRLFGAPIDAKAPFECVLWAGGNAVEWRPAEAATDTPVRSETAASRSVTAPAIAPNDEQETLIRIANNLRTAAAVVSAARVTVRPRPKTATPFAAPRNPIEESLARTWSECLNIAPIGIKDNFLDFGGHSLLATRILARAHAEFGVDLNLTKFFEAPTVEGMAAWVADLLSARLSSGAESPALIR